MKKKLTIPLLILVLLLWGAIFYRIFSGPGEGGNAPVVAATPAKVAVAERAVDDSLLLDYRDPFLGHMGALPAMAEDTLMMEEYEYVEEVPYIDWSQVQYFGSVDGGREGKAVALVGVGGREYMMKPGETVEGYTLVGAVGNSIVLNYQGQTGTITLQGKQ